MIPRDIFDRNLKKIQKPPNEKQLKAIDPGPDVPLFVVAGPGSGKTTLLTVRILKLILVDGVAPKSIMATTFTKKAAAELRSRILGNGYKLIEKILSDSGLSTKQRKWLKDIDINQVITGTIDSICEQLLREYRDAGTLTPVLADDFVTYTLILREGLLAKNRYAEKDLYDFLVRINGRKWGFNVGAMAEMLKSIWDRRFNDQVDWPSFVAGAVPEEGNARQLIDEALQSYKDALESKGMVDFVLMEQEILERLRSGRLKDFTDNLQVIMVDEYQDTNLLQERIYFELAKSCNGALTVVGDDDQSLYRFRGATVELFSNFPERYRQIFKKKPKPVWLVTNYRSTKTIVDFVNKYVQVDAEYQKVRVAGKPALEPNPKSEQGLPVLGMFRDDIQTLGRDLAQFIHQVFRGAGYKLPSGEIIQRSPSGGDVGDCAVLCGSPKEYKNDGIPRLPGLLRENLRSMQPPIEVFNPRGQDITNIDLIQKFGGLILECLDPEGKIQDKTSGLSDEIIYVFNHWRRVAKDYVNGPSAPPGLLDYLSGWAKRNPGRKGYIWPESVPVLELIYDLTYWFPFLYESPEGQVYLELFTRQISSTEPISSFSGRVVTNPKNPGLSKASVKEILRNVLAPIASGAVKVNEDIMENFPRDQLSILSIHQSKGLQFPMIIVDVGSDFKTNHRSHAFKRFPAGPGPTHKMEDLLRPHSPLKKYVSGKGRKGVDRAFDDLFRQYFVAYSRPEKILMLVGLTTCLPTGRVNTVFLGCDRTGRNCWPEDPLLYI